MDPCKIAAMNRETKNPTTVTPRGFCLALACQRPRTRSIYHAVATIQRLIGIVSQLSCVMSVAPSAGFSGLFSRQ